MRAMTATQRSRTQAASWAVLGLGAAAVVLGILVWATDPFGGPYAMVGILAGVIAGAVGAASLMAARNAPCA